MGKRYYPIEKIGNPFSEIYSNWQNHPSIFGFANEKVSRFFLLFNDEIFFLHLFGRKHIQIIANSVNNITLKSREVMELLKMMPPVEGDFPRCDCNTPCRNNRSGSDDSETVFENPVTPTKVDVIFMFNRL